MPALETHNNIGPATEPVDDLAFAFVAPLGAHNCYVCHDGLSVYELKNRKF
jgi:hypothetical protein